MCPKLAFNSAGVPSAITRPWSTTMMLRARRSASSRYCVVSRTVVPPATRFSMTPQRSCRLWGSSPVVGSSKKSTGGRATSAAARSSRRRMPPEYVLRTRSPASVRPKFSRSSTARALDVFQLKCESRPTIRMFSRPVRFSSTAAYWPAKPMIRRTVSASFTTSWPRMEAVPVSGVKMVERMRTAVVLPAPLGPSNPRTVPSSTWRETWSSARTLPRGNTLTRSCASTANEEELLINKET